MNFDKICDGLRAINGFDEKPIDKKIEMAKIVYAVQSFMNPKKNLKIQATDTGIGVTTDIAEGNKSSQNFIMETADNDNLYEQAIMTVPIGEGQNSWEIHTGTSGIAMALVQEGEKIGLSSVTGTKVTAYLAKYGMGIGFTSDMLKFRQIAKMFEMMTEARNAYLIRKATVYYDLIKAAVGSNITTFRGAASEGETRRDILTINEGVQAIGNRMKLKVPNAATGSLLMYANPDDEDRIEAAYRVKTSDKAGALGKNKEVTIRPVTRLYTYQITKGSPILVWPGRKNQKAEVDGLRQLTGFDILIDTYLQAYYTYMAGICADGDQFQQLTLG
jgi:hypothetical protein